MGKDAETRDAHRRNKASSRYVLSTGVGDAMENQDQGEPDRPRGRGGG